MLDGCAVCREGWMDGWIGWMKGWMDGQYERMDE